MATSASTFNPNYAVPTGWLLQDHIEALGISPAEFAQRCHYPPEFICDIISGFGIVDSYAATKFGRETGLVEHIWLGVEEDFRRKLAEFGENAELSQWAGQFPVKELVRRGAVSERLLDSDPMARMMSFYNFWSLEEWEDRYGPEVVTYCSAPEFENNRQAIAAWLRLGEIQAEGAKCPKYGKAKFRKSLTRIRGLTNSQQGLPELLEKTQSLCLESGVVLLVIEPLSGAAAESAAWWLPADKFMDVPAKPVILLRSQHETDASLWHSLFHAAAHILLHSKKQVFLDGMRGKSADEASQESEAVSEADQWAQDFLVPLSDWNKFAATFLGGEGAVKLFAEEQGIAPGIVVGRLQREGHLPWNRLNELKRKLEWAESSA